MRLGAAQIAADDVTGCQAHHSRSFPQHIIVLTILSVSSLEMAEAAPADKPVPVIAGGAPLGVDLEEGKEYYWCTCGLSKKQPFCDGSHRAAGIFKPLKFTAAKTGKAYLCNCKNTQNPPYCDGTHNSKDVLQAYISQLLKANTQLREENEALKAKV
eukprot:m.223080 g.223080  ORF g.223080 m.223080 type:complete len:157 (+) comp16172_c0_seq1:304-774(+)